MTIEKAFLDATIAAEIKALIVEAGRIKEAAEKLLPDHIAQNTQKGMSTLGIALSDNDLFDREIPSDLLAEFNGLFARIGYLPDVEKKFIGHSLQMANIGPYHLKNYAQPGRGPQLVVFPAVLQAVIGGLMLIDNATATSDIALRHFYIRAMAFCHTADDLKSGEMRDRGIPELFPSSPDKIEKARAGYVAERQYLCALFDQLEPRHIRIMNNQLATNRPLMVVGKDETEEQAATRVRNEWAPFRNGTRTIETLMKDLMETEDPTMLERIAVYIQTSTRVWPFCNPPPLMSFDVDDEMSEISNATFGDNKPKPKLN
jgi:hypothetical protein